MFSTADFVDSVVGHADPWKLRWFLSRFSTSNCTFDDMPQGVSGAIKKRGGFQPFRELGRVGGRRNRMEIPRRKISTQLGTGGLDLSKSTIRLGNRSLWAFSSS
jgi:hypothetical protein